MPPVAGTTHDHAGGVRWAGRVVAIGYACALVSAVGGFLGSDTWHDAGANALLCVWIVTSWAQLCKIERLKANAGFDREPDEIIKSGGVTIRKWFNS